MRPIRGSEEGVGCAMIVILLAIAVLISFIWGECNLEEEYNDRYKIHGIKETQ